MSMIRRLILSFILLMIPHSVLASSDVSVKRHFMFPTEIVKLSGFSGKKYKVVGVVSQLSKNNDFSYDFFISDDDQTLKVIFDGLVPDLMDNGIPVAIAATWDGKVLTADTIWAKFTGKYLTDAELSELQSYGLPVYR